MLHHFAESTVAQVPLVRSTDVSYMQEEHSGLSMLVSAADRGYKRDGTSYSSKAAPPVSFGYTAFAPGAQRFQNAVCLPLRCHQGPWGRISNDLTDLAPWRWAVPTQSDP